MPTVFKFGNLKARDQLEKLGVDEKIILKWIVKKQRGVAWTLYQSRSG